MAGEKLRSALATAPKAQPQRVSPGMYRGANGQLMRGRNRPAPQRVAPQVASVAQAPQPAMPPTQFIQPMPDMNLFQPIGKPVMMPQDPMQQIQPYPMQQFQPMQKPVAQQGMAPDMNQAFPYNQIRKFY